MIRILAGLVCGTLVLTELVAADRSGSWLAEVPIDGAAVRIRVRAPLHPTAPCPVILMSHGLGGSRDGYVSVTTAWADAGYVVIQPDHPGSDTATLRDAFRQRGAAAGRAAMASTAKDPQVAISRPLLINALIDQLPAVRAAVPDFTGTFDDARIGVAGHSFGAWTALAVAGAPQATTVASGRMFRHAKPLAFIAMSPPGINDRTDDPALWRELTRPVLMMSGTNDRQATFLNPSGADHGLAWRIKAFELLPVGPSALTILTDGYHCTFSDGQGAAISGEPPPEPWMGPAIAQVTTTWWNAWLRDDAAARTAVADGSAVPMADRQRMTWQARR